MCGRRYRRVRHLHHGVLNKSVLLRKVVKVYTSHWVTHVQPVQARLSYLSSTAPIHRPELRRGTAQETGELNWTSTRHSRDSRRVGRWAVGANEARRANGVDGIADMFRPAIASARAAQPGPVDAHRLAARIRQSAPRVPAALDPRAELWARRRCPTRRSRIDVASCKMGRMTRD